MDSWIPTFIAAHPAAAFLIACPVSLVLISWAWMTATMFSAALTGLLQALSLFVNAFVITVRGYAPQSAEAESDAQPGDE